ncbi:MAG: hydrogenase expression protein [Thermomicrobiales bacterium]|nr:hydrogenase expression protein [Thermomicrobiales bacterium]
MNREKLLQPLPAGKLPGWLLKKVLPPTSADEQVLVGPGVGRDAAAVAIRGEVVVAKTDPITFATNRAAFHLVEVNANDIACMGAVPRWLLVTSLLPVGVTPADVLASFAELGAACRARGVELIGGHTEIVPGIDRPLLIGSMLGETSRGHLISPGGARAGDVLMLTKGLAVEGTALLAQERAAELEPLVGEEMVRRAARLLHEPGISVVADCLAATSVDGVSAMHDPTEGGLATAIREIAAPAGLGAKVEARRIPILPETIAVCDALGLDPLGLLASGSLLLSARPERAADVRVAIAATGLPVAKIGVLTAETDFTLERDGDIVPLPDFAVDEIARLNAGATA